MAKNTRKFLAWAMVLTLLAGQLAIPVSANETVEEAANTSTVTTDVEGGTQTVTITVDSGTTTTTTEVSTSNPDTGTSSQSTTTEVVTTSGGGTQTNVDTNWSSTTTQTGSDTEAGNPTVQTDTNITTTVSGSENTSQSITHHADGSETVEGSNKGQEETITTGTTVTTTTTSGVLISDEDSSETDTTATPEESSFSSTGWVEGEVTEGNWQEGQVQQGTTLTTTDSSSDTTEIKATNPGEATISMKPDGKTVEVEVDVTIDEVLAGTEIPEGAVEITKDGETIGYKVVTVTESSTISGTTEGETSVSLSTPVQKPVAPTGYTEGTVTEGNVTTVTEAILDDDDNVIGYRVTRTTVTEDTGSSTTESSRDTTTETTTGETSYSLPERPPESEATDKYGYVTKTVVEDILEGDKVVGYKSITTYYDPDGEAMRTESSSIYGTTSSSSTQVQKDPETEVKTVKTTTTKTEVNEIFATVSTRDVTLVTERTNNITTTILTEEDTYQLVETEDGLYFLYKGTMQPVVALSGHSNVSLTGLTPTAKPSAANDLANFTAISNPPSIVNPGAPGSDQFKYVDYGLISDFRVTKANGGNTSEVHLYKLVDKAGNAYYAYCADLDTTAYRNTIYDISNAKDENYYQNNQDQDAYAHLQTIAINGYWGTSSDTGSMDSIRTLLGKDENKAYLKTLGYTDAEITNIINSITDGEAMTATQAAIWTFGNKSSSNLVNTSNPAANVSDPTSRKNIEALYDLLISDTLNNATNNTETDIITEKDLSGATLALKGQVTDNKGEVVTDSKGNEKYKADLSFTLTVEESALTGNLKVIVTDENGKKLCDDIQLLTENSNFLGKALADGSGYSYTIENLEIAEGVTINLNLEGYQNLKKGVYIYTAATGSHEDSQTFIGISEGTRDVKLQTQLKFTVEDPQLEHVEKSTTQTREDTRVDQREDRRTDTKTDTDETSKITVSVVTDTNVKTYGTETVTETKQDITKENRSWESHWKYDLITISGDDSNGSYQPTGKKLLKKNLLIPDEEVPPTGKKLLKKNLLIPDEEIPLAKAPKTGDLSGIWAIVSGLSLGGLALLNAKRKEEE